MHNFVVSTNSYLSLRPVQVYLTVRHIGIYRHIFLINLIRIGYICILLFPIPNFFPKSIGLGFFYAIFVSFWVYRVLHFSYTQNLAKNWVPDNFFFLSTQSHLLNSQKAKVIPESRFFLGIEKSEPYIYPKTKLPKYESLFSIRQLYKFKFI